MKHGLLVNSTKTNNSEQAKVKCKIHTWNLDKFDVEHLPFTITRCIYKKKCTC